MLEQEYQKALKDIGLGHKGIKELEEYEKWKVLRQKRDREIALNRGNQALNQIHNQKATENKIKENKINLRKSIALTERLRAAEVRAGRESLKNINKIRVVEIDANDKTKKVRFLDKGKVLPAGKEETETVRRIPLSDISTNGVEAAIREQELDKRKGWEAEKREIELARIRAQASLRKSRDEKENQLPISHVSNGIPNHSSSAPIRKIASYENEYNTIDNERIPTVLRSQRTGTQEHQESQVHPINGLFT